MKILAVDTATASCSAAVMRTDGSLLAELTKVETRTHSMHLMNIINCVCDLSGIEIGDLGGFAVTVGPGSFTGLRIGISTIKGLAWSLKKPVVGISSLDALAWQCQQSDYLICPLLDARKKEVYFCRYRFQRGELKKEGIEQVGAPEQALHDIREPSLFVGSGALLYREIISAELGALAQFASATQHVIRASSVAGLSLSEFNACNTDDIALLVPHYIRKSDAEFKGQRKKG